jgi:hypothetical protein
MSDATATIEVTTSHMPASVAQEAVNPTIEIDGQPQEGRWGLNTFAVSPGQHTIKAYHRWLVFKEAYASSTTIDVAEGQTVRLGWHTGAAAFRPAKWSAL